jgi:hypothetical protein
VLFYCPKKAYDVKTAADFPGTRDIKGALSAVTPHIKTLTKKG